MLKISMMVEHFRGKVDNVCNAKHMKRVWIYNRKNTIVGLLSIGSTVRDNRNNMIKHNFNLTDTFDDGPTECAVVACIRLYHINQKGLALNTSNDIQNAAVTLIHGFICRYLTLEA